MYPQKQRNESVLDDIILNCNGYEDTMSEVNIKLLYKHTATYHAQNQETGYAIKTSSSSHMMLYRIFDDDMIVLEL